MATLMTLNSGFLQAHKINIVDMSTIFCVQHSQYLHDTSKKEMLTLVQTHN